MKKLIGILCGILFAFSLAACENLNLPFGKSSESTQSEEISENNSDNNLDNSDQTSQTPETHVHTMTKTAAKAATCEKEGNIAYWYCAGCEKYFADAKGKEEIALEDTVVEITAHDPVFVSGITPTCLMNGKKEYYDCSTCTQIFADEACTKVLGWGELLLSKTSHDMTHHEEVPVVGAENGVLEHWTCNVCEKYFADEKGTQQITAEDTIKYSVLGIPDFIVEVPEGRDPVVLQLSDTQIIDAGQAREGREGVDYAFWATDQIEERCYDYVTEVIEATDPDFIIITGDVIYGEFDDNGSVWLSFIEFMESFEIPWSPVFGNHDNESKMGVDWQCEQLENAEHCLFEQKELTGNGNYSVGIVQGGEIKRVFYMLDSNGCGNVSAESLANGHTTTAVGFGKNQIEWYTDQIEILKEYSPDTKISFAYHIQQAIFEDAYAKYGFDQSEEYQNINIDRLENKAEGDFGYIGRQLKGPWDTNKSVYNGMKALGVDSIFVGHEHCNSASVVYDGIRFQFGQKSSEYDRFNCISADGVITGGYSKTGTSLIGGTVIVLSETDGAIEDAYIYYCSDEEGKIVNGQINWDKYKPIEVTGLKKGKEIDSEGVVGMDPVEFDETTNAYKLTANDQGKILVNPEVLKGKSSLSFSIFVPTDSNIINNWGAFVLRFKVSSDDGSIAQLPGAYNDATNKYYQIYKESETNEAIKIVEGEWKTYTVDISGFADECTEFAFLIAAGNTLYLKDVTVA
ncbi:MAG: metallophosphoesterase [Clostridia bacterium]|nr:metallophosphoesterase [Clostridia bacterium]